MPRRSAGGGGGSYLSQAFRRHVYSMKNLSSSTEDDVVQFLRSNYPHYQRTKADTLRFSVRKMLLESPPHKPQKTSVSSPSTSVGSGDEEGEASRKKPRRGNESEERLRRMEIARLQRIRPSQEAEGSSESEGSKSSDDESGETSESEDAIYEEKMEPKFDLMNSMIRDSYKEKPKEKEEEKNVEMELPAREKVAMRRTVVPGTGEPASRVNAKRDSGKVSSSIEDAGDAKTGPMFSDLGGMNAVLKELEKEVLLPLCSPELHRWLGVRPLSGILLHGPPGCGKTQLAHAIANQTGVPFYKISATDIVSGVSGASEENLRELFTKAHRTAPSIIFIDEIDAIAAKREKLDREMEKRIVTQLLTCMDDSHTIIEPSDGNLNSKSESKSGFVLVIGATNRPNALDPALRRPGRFDREIFLKVPDESARLEILSLFCKKLRLEGSFDLLKVAKSTPGFVGADLKAVANKAGNLAINRIASERESKICDCSESCDNQEWYKKPWLREEMEKLSITMADFEEAVKEVQPSSKREGFSEIPDKKWEDVGGLDNLRKEFERYIVRRIKCPEDYERFGVDLETGFLLYGPPGCGKTLIAKAVANEAGANFIHVKGPELLNKYVGESELAIRTLFSRARTCSPCIIFFDEVDALTTNRGREGANAVVGCVNQLLIELDGAEQRRGVYVIGATNRPQLMDKAVIRPGRFGKLLYVPLPSAAQRALILEAVGRKKPIDASVDLNEIAHMEACENFSGADLFKLMNEAAMVALEERQASENSAGMPDAIKTTHFELALKKISPSVSKQDNELYEKLWKTFK